MLPATRLLMVALLMAGPLSSAQAAQKAAPPSLPACRTADLQLSLDGRDGGFNGMSHGGTALVIRNTGRDCSLPALPPVEFRDAQGKLLQTRARKTPGAQPARVHIAGGHRAALTLRWVSGPVYPHSRSAHVAEVGLVLGAARLSAPLDAQLYGEAGVPILFERSALRAMEGMAADR